MGAFWQPMKDTFINRLAMFRASLQVLEKPEFKTLWFSRPPLKFTEKAAQALAMTDDLGRIGGLQEAGVSGTTAQKAKEEAELEQAAFEIGQRVSLYLLDQGNLADAQKVRLPLSRWQALRDEALLEKARLLVTLATAAADAQGADYGITPGEVARLTQELEDFALFVEAPAAAIAERKALTESLRERFAAVEQKFQELDALIRFYGQTAEGKQMIAVYENARSVRDLGANGGKKPDVAPVVG